MKSALKKIAAHPLAYWLLAAAVAAVFFILALSAAHQLPSRVDEGSYLIKGYYYLTGRYVPFEEYGPWTNNMPLAYYVPGVGQVLFGPGLMAGRYFAIFITLLTLIGLWLVMRRLRGKWWALLGISALVINPSFIQTNVQAISQGIVACLITWMLVCLLGEARKDWQVAAGALLCALTILNAPEYDFPSAFRVDLCLLAAGQARRLVGCGLFASASGHCACLVLSGNNEFMVFMDTALYSLQI